MLANTSANEANEKLGGTFFNISMRGGDFYERSFPLKKALDKNIHKVIYSLDRYYLLCSKGDPSFSTARWVFLYDENPFNDLLCYASIRDIRSMFAKNFGLRARSLDRPEDWFQSPDSARFGGLSKWVDAMSTHSSVSNFLLNELPAVAAQTEQRPLTVAHDPQRERLAREYLDAYLLKYVRDYPQTEFYCVFPPYFRYTYAQWLKTQPQEFFLHQEVIRYMTEKSETLSNLHIYGFEDQDFLDDIANYKDTTHYHPWVNSLMLDAIHEGTHLLTPENMERYLRDCLEKAWNFDIGALNAQARRLVRERGAPPSH
ncbi:MAG: hypothetical protein J1E80_08695 [Desulfovibrionaceae bacterium]|nr:hypothetical protein [Desulfovibrionaceae bacterium]